MIKTKVYLYDSLQENNGYRGQDFSKYVLQGNEETEDITQQLDVGELTLCGLSFQKEFDPETKLIIDIVENDDFGAEEIVATFHKCVSTDIVSQPILSDQNYFDHHISLIEPSIIAQKRLVDNISTTFKLKNVSLKTLPAFPDDKIISLIETSKFSPSDNFGITTSSSAISGRYMTAITGKYFEMEDKVRIFSPNGEEITNIYNNIESFFDGESYNFSIQIPKLAIYYGVSGSKNFSKIGYASLDYEILETNINDENAISNTIKGTIISNSNLGNGISINNVNFSWKDTLDGEWLLEQGSSSPSSAISKVDYFVGYYKKYTETSATEPNYTISNIPIQKDKKYIIKIFLHQFDDNLDYADAKKYVGENPSFYNKTDARFYSTVSGDTIKTYTTSSSYLVSSQTIMNSNIITYDIDTATIVYSSSIPYSALALLQKAIINSSIYEKQNGTYIADINNSNLPFYIDSNFVDDLNATVIIENFYNQKNLWEIMIEVGHYIHAIPELRFGNNDRFEITFNRLGRTDEQNKKSNKISIFNSRNIEEYVSATSSYIANMVQLGGTIEEWVFPKTTNEQLLVSNDTAEIIVSKPIIELLSVKVKNNTTGDIADMTKFIYEENVYKTLQLDYQVDPNRGIAMYYSLGNNVITGGQFQLPQANANIYSDYAFKKIIWCAFNGYPAIAPQPDEGYWMNLKVQDYSFFVQYRTKDSVRQNHIRPDLRKYLLNSKFDKFPQHNQFNNQTDVVVDSLKFGNNMYGKLIKTGNSSYEITEWNDKYADLKHKGELYRINGELYYVAKATHYFFSSHYISRITYSKDYNELSAVIGIPSEPRFYEISEQSLIWREFALNDLLLLTDKEEELSYGSNYVFNYDHLSGLMLGEETDFAKYAITVYKGDKDTDKYSQTIGQPNLYKEVLNPINAYSSENTLTYEWDMIDNYSAGDKVISTDKENYSSLRAVGYTDIYGKAALMDFYILGDIGELTTEQIKELPESPIKTQLDNIEDTRPFVGDLNILGTNVKSYDTNFNGRGIGLLKDCRESLSINFNLQLATNSDTFVLSPYVYLPNKQSVKIVLLAEEVNKLSSGYINNSEIITPIDIQGNTMNPYFDFQIEKFYQTSSWDNSKNIVSHFGIDFESLFENVAEEHFTGADGYQRVKSIAVLCNVPINVGVDSDVVSTIPYKTQFVFARNIPDFWSKSKATSPIYFGSPNKDVVFTNKQ